MALYPGATLRLLPENETQGRIVPRAIIAHSAGGGGELYGWWMNDQSRGLESHFWIGWNGEIYQYMDTDRRADANGEANGFAISIETASTTHASEPWTDAQVAALIRLCVWLCATHPGIATRLMEHPTDSGLAWHIQFGAPGPWTKARGKVCPGPARIAQFRDVIVPAVAAAFDGPPATPPSEEDFMTSDEAKALLDRLIASNTRIEGVLREHDEILSRLQSDVLDPRSTGIRQTIKQANARAARAANASEATAKALAAHVDLEGA